MIRVRLAFKPKLGVLQSNIVGMSNRCLNFTVSEKLFFKNLPVTRGPLHSGAPWTLPTLPIPLLRRCLWGSYGQAVNETRAMTEVFNK